MDIVQVNGKADHGFEATQRLEAGVLTVRVREAVMPADELFGFAERDNPHRAFLFVSKVLGRHVPASPARMRKACESLAAQVPADLPGPVLMTGMAETAVGLGAGVHRAYVARTGRDDVLYVASTRAGFDRAPALRFVEAHSHAPSQLMHWPLATAARASFVAARSLVMVDDEASTGATFRNLAAALAEGPLRRIDRVETVVLTDWSAGGAGAATWRLAGRDVAVGSAALLRGSYSWAPAPSAPRRSLAAATAGLSVRWPPPQPRDSRFGVFGATSVTVPSGLRFAPGAPRAAKPVHVVGMGEHVWEPFLLAEALEAAGHCVRFSASTRSPIVPGLAIAGGFVFGDHEGVGYDAYLYNVDPDAAERVILCCDTGRDAVDRRLLASLGCDLMIGDRFIPREALADDLRGVAPARRIFADRSRACRRGAQP